MFYGNTGGIKGVIVDEHGKPLFSANVILLGTTYGAATNFKGEYRLANIPPGNYKLKVSYVGYKKIVKNIEIIANRFFKLDFKLEPEVFQVGGITVTAKEDLLPTQTATKTDISSGEIEHYQATNLGDVLDLVPGVQKSQNPGINKTSQIAIRGDETDRLSAFGTKVIIDGEPVSNNANMQFEALTGAKFGVNSMGGSVDLRTIPADNLESVSVISGMPSVRYGDFSNGIIELKTKMGVHPHRIKIKHNPRTTEANLGGGFPIGSSSLSYNLNAARSQRDLRITGDEYTRLTGQLVYSTLHSSVWKASYKLKGQAIHDEEEPKNSLLQTNNYNRGYGIGFNTWGTWRPFNEVSKFTYNAYLNWKKIDSRKSKLVANYVITPEGDTLASYTGVLHNKGNEWTSGGRLEWHNVFFTGDYIHNFLVGLEGEYDNNTGEGVVFDTLFNYYGVESKKRPYSFDDVPGQFLLSFYAEDKLTGHFLCDFSLMFGFRYEMYRPYAFNIGGLWGDGDLVKSHQGTFFNPRISLLMYLSSKNQLRINFGSSSKSPAMSTLYPPETVFNWRNPATGNIETFRYNTWVPDLQGYKTTQYEISYDHKFFNSLGVSLTAYYRSRKNSPKSLPQPVFKEINDNGKIYAQYVDKYYLSQNLGEYISKGLEFTLRTAKIKPLNMNFKVTGAFTYNKTPSTGYSYSVVPDTSIGQYPNYKVHTSVGDTLIGWTYPQSGQWKDKFQINYYIKYTNKTLGLWVTLRAEQLITDRYQFFNLQPVDYNKLSDNAKEVRDYYETIIVKPPKWLFSFNVSKSLFKGAEVSFYVNNFMDDPAIWSRYHVPSKMTMETIRNPELFYGLEFSMIL